MVVNKTITSEQLAQAAIAGLQEKKGHDIVLIDLRDVPNAFTDFFAIASGNSDRQVDALRQSVEEMVYKQTGEHPIRVEGQQALEWVLADYVNVVVHIFLKPKREFFGLEALWGDGKITRFEAPD